MRNGNFRKNDILKWVSCYSNLSYLYCVSTNSNLFERVVFYEINVKTFFKQKITMYYYNTELYTESTYKSFIFICSFTI